MFPLDGPAAFEEFNKLSFLADAIQMSRTQGADEAEPDAIYVQGTGGHPFILVERGADFADSLHEDFFPRTFPKLFLWGRGSPKALHVGPRATASSGGRRAPFKPLAQLLGQIRAAHYWNLALQTP